MNKRTNDEYRIMIPNRSIGPGKRGGSKHSHPAFAFSGDMHGLRRGQVTEGSAQDDASDISLCLTRDIVRPVLTRGIEDFKGVQQPANLLDALTSQYLVRVAWSQSDPSIRRSQATAWSNHWHVRGWDWSRHHPLEPRGRVREGDASEAV